MPLQVIHSVDSKSRNDHHGGALLLDHNLEHLVTLADGIDHVLAAGHLAEDRVTAVQVGLGCQTVCRPKGR